MAESRPKVLKGGSNDLEWQCSQALLGPKQSSLELICSLENSDGLGFWGGINWYKNLLSKDQIPKATAEDPSKMPHFPQPGPVSTAASISEHEADIRAAIACHLRDNLSFELLQRRVRGLQLGESRSSPGHSDTPDSDTNSSDPPAFISGSVEDLVIEVLLERFMAAPAIERSVQSALGESKESKIVKDMKDSFAWWSFTLRLAEQFYAMTSSRFIDVRRFFAGLKAKRLSLSRDDSVYLRGLNVSTPFLESTEETVCGSAVQAPLTDNSLLYACLQITSNEELRRILLLDCSSTDNGGSQAPLTVKDTLDFNSGMVEILESLYLAPTDSSGAFNLRDDSYFALVSKLKGQSLTRESLPMRMRDDVSARFEKLVTRQTVDLARLNQQDSETLCLMSLYDFRSPCIAILKYHGIPLSGPIANNFPWLHQAKGLAAKSRQFAVPTHVLACLSVRTKMLLLDLLEREFLYASKPVLVDSSLVETFCRLVILSPYTYPAAKLLKMFSALRSSTSVPQCSTILQLLSWRLLRQALQLCTAQKLFLELAMPLVDAFNASVVETNPLLFEQYQTLQLKLCLQLSEVPVLPVGAQPRFSETVVRILIYGLARMLRVKGLRDLGSLRELGRLVALALQQTSWRPPTSSLQCFPQKLREMIEQAPLEPCRSPRKLDELVSDTQSKLMAGATAVSQRDHQRELLERLKHDEDLQVQIPSLCWAWAHAVSTKKISRGLTAETALNHIQFAEIIKNIPPKQLVKGTYELIRFILHDEAVVDVMPEVIARLIWQHGLLRIDNVLIALADGLPGEKALRILNHLLHVDATLKDLCQQWNSLEHNSPQHWINDDCSSICDFISKIHCPGPRREAYTSASPAAIQLLPWDVDCLLPVFEIIVCRMIEESLSQQLADFIGVYGQMFSFHTTPVSCLHGLLFYYYSISDLSIRTTLASVAAKFPFASMIILESYRKFMDQPVLSDGSVNIEPLNLSFVLESLSIIQRVSSTQQITDNGPWAPFEEAGGLTSIRSVVTAFTLQLMACGMSFYWQPDSEQFNYPREIACLISYLPPDFERVFHEAVDMFLPINVKWTCNLASSWLWNLPSTRFLEMPSVDGVVPAAFAPFINSRCKSYEEMREIFHVLLPLLPRLFHESSLFECALHGLFVLLLRSCSLIGPADSASEREQECLQACVASLRYVRSIFSVSAKLDAAIKAAALGLPLEVRSCFSS
eukprot:TRINITY_DN504_c0_g3_i2.p1 TRINITY_DN504_c0_g3~~TRINITY_DN504_c0_g3_i2.p1  ORF type:complete len:1214 (+),score=116.86 TRINITY_DN504_c0_g3_i2:133-3774(+)